MLQLILHLLGDYATQSHWMAQNKTKSFWAALCHAEVYSLPFLLIASPRAFLIILITHFLIDRFGLARHVVYVKNIAFSPPIWIAWIRCAGIGIEQARNGEDKAQFSLLWNYRWRNCSTTGYPAETPPWLAVWLQIICDNTMHLAINYFAIWAFPSGI